MGSNKGAHSLHARFFRRDGRRRGSVLFDDDGYAYGTTFSPAAETPFSEALASVPSSQTRIQSVARMSMRCSLPHRRQLVRFGKQQPCRDVLVHRDTRRAIPRNRTRFKPLDVRGLEVLGLASRPRQIPLFQRFDRH